MDRLTRTLTRSILALVCAFSLHAAAPALAQCAPSGDANSVSVGLITQPFAYADLEPALTAEEIAALPALPDPADEEIALREHAYISTALAQDLHIAPHDPQGTATVHPDWKRPNPQIRVWITNPSTFSNWKSGTTYRDRKSSAAFTVVGVIEDTRRIVWVYKPASGVDDDSGQYKLFAKDTASGSSRVRAVASLADDNGDGILDTVTATVFRTPVSSRTVTRNGVATTTQNYCEPDANGSFTETAVNAGDSRFALLVPHGNIIETNVSPQIAEVVNTLQSADYEIPVNVWEGRGAWGDDQTFQRWHITSINLHESSFPGLREMLDQDKYDPQAGWAFRRALALHGFTESDKDLIIGGGTARNAKCLVAKRIRDELGTRKDEVAIRIFDGDDIIDILAGTRRVCRRDLEGQSGNNIVNRLAADGGVQIEQSGSVRSDQTLRNGVARGAAKAMGELLKGTAPTDACNELPAAVDEDEVPDC